MEELEIKLRESQLRERVLREALESIEDLANDIRLVTVGASDIDKYKTDLFAVKLIQDTAREALEASK